MSYNRSLLNFITKNLDKKPSKPSVPRNQWQHPGEVTKVNSPNITMDAVSYPVLGVPNVGQPQMMYPDEQYNFPGASNVTEFPQMAKGGQLDKYQTAGQFISRFPNTFNATIAESDATKIKPGVNGISPETLRRRALEAEIARRQTYIGPQGARPSVGMRQAAEDRIAKQKSNAFTRKVAEAAQTVGGTLELAAPFTGPFMPIVGGVGAGLGMGSSAYLAGKDIAEGNYGDAALNAGFGALDLAGFGALRSNKVKNFVQGADNVADYSQVVDLTGVGSSLDDNIFKNSLGIDWAKWNKEIPGNKPLMQEYKAIEETSKANGTWMKNADGSVFKGTPEQFVQFQSSNFKKAFPKGHTKIYRGSNQHVDDFVNRQRADWALFGSDNPDVAKAYANNTEGPVDFYRPDTPQGWDHSKKGLYELAFPNEAKVIEGNASGRDFTLLDYNDQVAKGARNPRMAEVHNENLQYNWNNGNAYKYSLDDFDPAKKYLDTDTYASYVKNTDNPETVAKINNVLDGPKDLPSNVYTIDAERVPIKSLRYNNGMFDMSNSNIYKSLVPFLGAGFAGAEYMNQKKYGGSLNKYQTQGEVYVDPEHSLNQKIKDKPFWKGVVGGLEFMFEDLPKMANNAIAKPITPFIYNNLTQQDREDLFNKYRPIDYPSIRVAAATTLKNMFSSEKPKAVRYDDKGNLSIEEEAWRKALDLPVKSNYIRESKYRPTSAKDPNAKYYTLHPNVIDSQKLIDYVKSGEWEKNKKLSKNGKDYYAQMSSFAPFIKDSWKERQGLDQEAFENIDPIQRFQMFKGYDPVKKKNYVSISDRYDFDFAPAQKVIKPYDIYDRFYYQNGGVAPVPVWNTYKSHLGNVYIMDGMKMPDGSINTNHPDVGKVNFVDSMNPSGGDALSAGYGYGRAIRNPEGNWVYPNPVNPKRTHPYVRVEEQMPDTRRKRSLYLNSPWSDDADKQDVINDIKRYKYQEGGQKYTVKEGEYLSQIAKANNISVEDLVLANKISNPNLIKPNQELIIPAATRGYSNPGVGGFQGFEQLQRTQEALSKLPSDQMVKEYRKQFNVPGNYAMVDKKAGKMFIYDQTGKELKNFPVGTGKVLGDEYTINTTGPTRRNSTPAGIFTLTNKGSGRDSYAPHYGDNIWEMIDHNGVQQATALHQVPNELPYRNALIGDANPANNRLSNGCINCRRKDFDTGVEKFLGKDSQVYILPEDQNNYFQVKNNKLVLTGDKYNPDVLYSKKDLTARPLQIKYAKSQFDGTVDNVQSMAQSLVSQKQQLMKDLRIDNDTYNELARLTLGIAGQESNYGDSWKYKYKEQWPLAQLDIQSAKALKNLATFKNPFDVSPNSRGFTQIKYESQNKDVRDLFAKYGIKSGDDLKDPAKSNIGALIMLGYMHNNELPQLKDKMKKLNLSKSDALLYLNQGKKSQITNMTATPQQNKYIRSVNDFAKRFVLNQKEQGGPVMGQQLEVSPDEMAELRKQGYKFKVVK